MDVGTSVAVEDDCVVCVGALVREVLVGDDVDSSDGDRVRELVRVDGFVAGAEVVAGVERGAAAGDVWPRRSPGAQSRRCFRAIHSGAPLAIASSGQVPR